MNESDMQKEIDKLDVVIQELRQDLDGAMRLRQVWKDRLAECAPSYFEVDAAHWDDLSLAGCIPLQGASPTGWPDMMHLIEAPWTAEQTETLNRLQRGELYGHPYTCPHRGEVPHHDNGHDTGCLLATKDGWICPDCGYTQDWAHASSLEAMSMSEMMRLLSHKEEACP